MGTPRRAGPPYGLPAQAITWGQFWTPIGGQYSTPIDSRHRQLHWHRRIPTRSGLHRGFTKASTFGDQPGRLGMPPCRDFTEKARIDRESSDLSGHSGMVRDTTFTDEFVTFNLGAVGSSPTGLTKRFQRGNRLSGPCKVGAWSWASPDFINAWTPGDHWISLRCDSHRHLSAWSVAEHALVWLFHGLLAEAQ
jgi:hypothetical protein